MSTRISYEEALERLNETLDVIELSSKKTKSAKRSIANYYTVGEQPTARSTDSEEEPFLYIVNFEDDRGFAIVSGDTRTTPVFAVTESGNLPQGGEIDNPGLMHALTGIELLYKTQVVEPTLNPEEPQYIDDYFVEYTPWKTFYYGGKNSDYVVWGQGDVKDKDGKVLIELPYNDLAKVINGQRALAGCVPTSVAQLCAYHKYPTNYKGYSFNWTEMKKHKNYDSGGYFDYLPAYPQIARFYAEISTPENLNANFGLEATGADSGNIPRTLKNLGFSNGGTHAGYNTSTIIEELKGKYPVIANAYSFKQKKKILGMTFKTYYSGGHSWLIEKVIKQERSMIEYNEGRQVASRGQVKTYVYCNWGWDGAFHGYYYSGIFDALKGPETITKSTSGQHNNYQYKQTMVHGIRK